MSDQRKLIGGIYDIFESVFFSTWWTLKFIFAIGSELGGAVLSTFLIPILISVIVGSVIRYFMVLLTYYIKIGIIKDHSLALDLTGAINRGVITSDWNDWRDQIDYLWGKLSQVMDWFSYWALNLLFTFLTVVIPLVVGGIVFGYMAAGAGTVGTILMNQISEVVINQPKQMLINILIDRAFRLFADIIRQVAGGSIASLPGGDDPLFRKWASF